VLEPVRDVLARRQFGALSYEGVLEVRRRSSLRQIRSRHKSLLSRGVVLEVLLPDPIANVPSSDSEVPGVIQPLITRKRRIGKAGKLAAQFV
jgi:hypothetical protein